MNKFLSILFLLLSLHAKGQKANDTFSVYFDLDVATMGESAKTRIDLLLYQDKIKRNVPVSIIGYADFLNTDEYNLLLSRRRAENVKQYLVASGMDASAIKLLVGKGEVKRGDTSGKTKGIPQDRRVDIVMEYHQPAKIRKDVVINMKPSEKREVPPSSSDPDFSIDQVPTGKTFILKNIYFPMSRHFPRQSSYKDIDMLLQAMKDNPNMRIQIEGHVCCVVNVPDAYDLDSHELDLSVNRARFIFEYLKARGIDTSRLKYVGYGRSRPIIDDEQTEEEASINRRVEIRILDR
jgi:outer membrane protein OmpA-like peptidoglycan-associated protein